jgi:hypothetical protein
MMKFVGKMNNNIQEYLINNRDYFIDQNNNNIRLRDSLLKQVENAPFRLDIENQFADVIKYNIAKETAERLAESIEAVLIVLEKIELGEYLNE